MTILKLSTFYWEARFKKTLKSLTNKTTQIANIKAKLAKAAGQSSFLIQGGHISPIYSKQKEFNTLAEVFSKIFSDNDEAAFIFWNKIPIRFHYNYEFFANWDNILEWLTELSTNKVEGEYHWVMQTDVYFVRLNSVWKNGALKIVGTWSDRRSKTGMADHLNKNNTINIEIDAFLKEWALLLLQVTNAIKTSGISFSSNSESEKMNAMYSLIASIDGAGKLYTK
jgi:hypothetical protein